MFVVEERRAQHRLGIVMRLPQQRVKVRQQTVAQFDGAADRGRHRRVHPRLVNGLIVIPRVNGKARMHHAVLHPAHEQLRVWFVAGETADVVTDVIQPRQAHTQPHANVVAQRLPAGAVIAAPGLDVALHPRAAGARNQVRAFLWREGLLGLH